MPQHLALTIQVDLLLSAAYDRLLPASRFSTGANVRVV
jgi:hypothetical protein